MKGRKQQFAFIGCIGLFFLLDRLSKQLAVEHLTYKESIPLLPDVFQLTLVYNKGMAFSLFQEHPALLLLFTSTLFAIFTIYCLSRPALSRLEFLAYTMVLGGAIGNIADRLLYGHVVDFLDVVAIQYPIFNVADILICTGVISLLAFYWTSRHPTTTPDQENTNENTTKNTWTNA